MDSYRLPLDVEALYRDILAHTSVNGPGGIVFRLVGDNNIFGPATGGRDATTGGDNFVAGDGAGVSLTGGFANAVRNILIGLGTGQALTEGSYNIGLGTNALWDLTTGDHNFAVGASALFNMVSDSNNIALGNGAMFRVEAGIDNIALGQTALRGAAASDVSYNIALGNSSMYVITTGAYNVASGISTLRLLTSGDYNIAFGDDALHSITTGDGSIGVGKDAGWKFNTTSAKCVAIGYEAGPVTLAVYDEEMYIDSHQTDTPTIHADFPTHTVTINGDLVVTGALTGGSGEFLKKDGTVELTANWDAGGFEIRSLTFESDVATGTAPLTIASETVVTNLNADQVDNFHHDQSLLLADTPSFAGFTKIGGASDYTTIEADGTIKFNGDATVWDDLRVPGTTVQKGASAPTFISFLGAGNLMVNAFDGNATPEQVFFTIQLPHSYKEGSDITPHVHWTPVNTDAGDVKWQLEYSWANHEDAFPAVTTISVVQASSTTAWDHHLANFSAISGTGKEISSMLVCRLFRDPTDGADTYGSDAAFLEFDVHFEIDTVGSRQILTK